MATFIMQTRLGHEALRSPDSLTSLSSDVMQHIRAACPSVEWKASYAVLGPADYIDIFEAPDIATATKVATIIRTFGHATTEVWAATEWKEFVDLTAEIQAEPCRSRILSRQRSHPRNGGKPMPLRRRA